MKKILCIGDSNTYGYDPRSMFGGRYPENVRWTGLLKAGGYDVLNCGQNGMCIPEHTCVESLLRKETGIGLITVMLGSNDILNGVSAETAGRRMADFIRRIQAVCPESDVILISPVPFHFGEWVSSAEEIEASEQLSAVYRKTAEECGVCSADAGAWNVTLSYDGVHYLPEGHQAFADGLRKTLEEIERTKKLEVLKAIAKPFNEAGIVWALGASMMLYFRGMLEDFHDIDLMVKDADAQMAMRILDELGSRTDYSKERFKTKHFVKYLIQDIEADLIGGFVIVNSGKEYDCDLREDEIDEYDELDGIRIPLQKVSCWRQYYEWMGRRERVRLIEETEGKQ